MNKWNELNNSKKTKEDEKAITALNKWKIYHEYSLAAIQFPLPRNVTDAYGQHLNHYHTEWWCHRFVRPYFECVPVALFAMSNYLLPTMPLWLLRLLMPKMIMLMSKPMHSNVVVVVFLPLQLSLFDHLSLAIQFDHNSLTAATATTTAAAAADAAVAHLK